MFQVGDVVELKSGGPTMTVSEVYNNGWLRTAWFLDGNIQVGDFNSLMLVSVDI